MHLPVWLDSDGVNTTFRIVRDCQHISLYGMLSRATSSHRDDDEVPSVGPQKPHSQRVDTLGRK